MAKETPAQQATIGRVMREFKQGALRSGQDGDGGRVRDPKQAIAIALSEAGASNQATPAQNRRAAARTRAAERRTAPRPVQRADGSDRTRADLYAEAKARGIPGRSGMTKAELARALDGR